MAALYADLEEIEQELTGVSESHEDGSQIIPLAQEGDWDPSNRILDEIRYLNDLIENKSARIAEIEKQLSNAKRSLSKSDRENAQFQAAITQLETELAESKNAVELAQVDLEMRTVELAGLRKKLEGKLHEIEELEFQLTNSEMENVLLARELDEQYTGYYITGNYKELKNAGIVERKGGVAGVGAVKKLKEDFPTQAFNSIDMRNTPVIPVDADKVEIITSHPENSYTLVEEAGKITSLEINDPNDFWKAGQVLVMVTK